MLETSAVASLREEDFIDVDVDVEVSEADVELELAEADGEGVGELPMLPTAVPPSARIGSAARENLLVEVSQHPLVGRLVSQQYLPELHWRIASSPAAVLSAMQSVSRSS